MSENQNNRVSILQAESYFFTETNITAQANSEGYGPVVGHESTQYRTTGKFNTSSSVKAFAICSGQILIQPNIDDPDKINLILRPTIQPVNGLSIKYFIYRGLNKADFLPSDEINLVPFSNFDTATELMKELWIQINNFNNWEAGGTPYDFLAKWIGYDPSNQPLTSNIEDYFFAIDEAGEGEPETKFFDLPLVKKGTEIGSFTGNYGVDVVLSDGDFKELKSTTGFQFNLQFARLSDNVIDIGSVPDGYVEKQYREAILRFMDPAAFFGLHYSDIGKLWVRDGDNSILKTQEELYNEVLIKFHTRNNVYIHVISEYGRSYNYYDNYLNPNDTSLPFIKYGTVQSDLQELSYPVNGWPILVVNDTQIHDGEFNSLFLQLIVKNESPVLYGQVASLDDTAENNFIRKNQLIPEQEEIMDPDDPPEKNYWSKLVQVQVAAMDISGNKTNVATYVKLLYHASNIELVETIEGEENSFTVKEIDMLFGNINIDQLFRAESGLVNAWSIVISNNIIDGSFIDESNKSNYVFQTKIIEDNIKGVVDGEEVVSQRVSYEVQILDQVNDGLHNRGSEVVTMTSGKTDYNIKNNNFYLPNKNYSYQPEIISDSTGVITGIKLLNSSGNSDKVVLGISKEESNLIKTVILLENIINPQFFFRPIDQDLQKKYSKYQLQVVGEINGILSVGFLESDIHIYSLDNKLYCSKNYSKNVLIVKRHFKLDLSI